MDTLIAVRRTSPSGRMVWMVSSETVKALPDLLGEVDVGLLQRVIPSSVPLGPWILGVPLLHWGVLLTFAGVCFATSVAATGLLEAHRLWRRRHDSMARRMIDAAAPPLRVCFAVWIFITGVAHLGISVVGREISAYLMQFIGWAGLAWFLWRITDTIGAANLERMARRNQTGALSAVRFMQRLVKVLVVVAAILIILDNMGVDVSTGLAALGIGGVAIALGAQKTFENLIGSLMLIADQPVREGDFCRFGQIMGTVEEIGMRSTRIRTLARTVVTVPNGEFSSLQLGRGLKPHPYP